jgi:hypothetical protein
MRAAVHRVSWSPTKAWVVLLIVSFALSSATALAAVVWRETKLTASDGAIGDFFGVQVAIAGDRVAVGSPGDDDYGLSSGSVHLFDPDGAGGWVDTKLTASDSAALDLFGISVAVDGDRVVVGATEAQTTNAGSVYVYESDGAGGWVETKLTPSDGTDDDFFGNDVAVDGGRVVVGAPGDATFTGSAYVYESDGAGGWVETKLSASDGAESAQYGISVAVDGDRIVVGANLDDGDDSGAGSAYLYESDGAGGCLETTIKNSKHNELEIFAY